MISVLARFCEFDFLLDAFKPLTPQGKTAKSNLALITNQNDLEKIYDKTEFALSIINGISGKADKIEWHLKRIPLIPDFSDEAFASADIFLIKKFLINASAVKKNLNQSFELDNLLSKLDLEQNGEESFYIASRYDENLAVIRKKIDETDKELSNLKTETLLNIKTKCGIVFDDKNFVLVDVKTAENLDSNFVFREPFDGRRIMLKPVFCPKHFELMQSRSNLIKEEKKIETKVLEKLSEQIHNYKEQILILENEIKELDLAMARARLATDFELIRPKLDQKNCIKTNHGRWLSLEKKCRLEGLKYWHLDIEIKQNLIVLQGSNMCGKTVVLQTLAFLQLSAQFGFFVSAKNFETKVFNNLALITSGEENSQEGLSAFGREIVSLNSAIKNHSQKSWLFFDEFARTTNSTDAIALLNGLIYYLNKNNFDASIATHYDSLPKNQAVFFRMKGVDWQGLEKEADESQNLQERLKNLYKHIEYVPCEDFGETQYGSAIKIAELLGAEKDFIKKAQEELKK